MKDLICADVRNPTQCSRVNLGFLNQSLPSSRNKLEKTTRKSGVFLCFEKHFLGPEKFSQKKSPEKFSGLRNFWVFWETHVWPQIWVIDQVWAQDQVLFLRVYVPRQSRGPVLLNPESSALLITMKPSSHSEDNMKFYSQFFWNCAFQNY